MGMKSMTLKQWEIDRVHMENLRRKGSERVEEDHDFFFFFLFFFTLLHFTLFYIVIINMLNFVLNWFEDV
jgi:hypothetical protein